MRGWFRGWSGMRRGVVSLAAAGAMLAGGAPGAGAQADADGEAQLMAGTTGPAPEGGARIAFAVPATSLEIEVDARLDDPGWASAARIPLAWEVNPGDNTPAPVATECRLTFDDENLYLGCVARDPDPGAIRAYVVDRDEITDHDRIVLTLDPFNDQRRAFQFGISALGVQSDAVLAQQGVVALNQGPGVVPVDPSWDAIWSSAGRITDDGFVVEAAVPFQSLRFPEGSGPGQWAGYLTRWWPRSASVQTRSATWDRDNACLLCQSNIFNGIDGGRASLSLQVSPTVTTTRTDRRDDFPAGPLRPGATEPQIGGDVQWGVTSNLTVNLTVNPDFSQVEADVPQLDVNNRFALYFPEKRPFFLEGSDFFGTPIPAVFTRSIADPDVGAKISGKVGSNALGALVARDNVNNLLLPGSQSSTSMSLEAPVTTAVARFRRDMGATSTLGGLYVGREGEGYHNRVAGLDAFYRPLGPLTLQLQYLRSSTEYPEAVTAATGEPTGVISGDGVQALAEWSTRSWLGSADYRRLTPGFRTDAGFLPQAGVRGGSARVIRRFWGSPGSWYEQVRVVAGGWDNRDFQGNRLEGGVWMGLQYFGPAQSNLSIWPNFIAEESYDGAVYRDLRKYFFTASIRPSGTVSLNLMGRWGDAVDYANQGLGREFAVDPSVELRLGRRINLNVQQSYQRLTRDGGRVFTAHLTRLRAVYSFSPRSYLRGVIQLRQTDRNPELYDAQVDRRNRTVFTQLLYAYKVNPQTVLFAGYTDDRNGLVDPDGRTVDLTQRGRTFFLKLGYAWRP